MKNLDTRQTQQMAAKRLTPGVQWADFRLILVGAAVLLALILLSGRLPFLQPVRLALGLVYILVVPGYCLTAALFPHRDDLDGIERTGLSLGLSIAWTSVLALILDGLGWKLRLWPIVTGELLSILLFSGAALWQRRRLPAEGAFAPQVEWQPGQWWRRLPPADRHAYWLIAVALSLMALALAWTFLVPTPDEFMTEFYMLGPEGIAEGFPRQVAVNEQMGVTLGLMNLERRAHSYRVEVWAIDPWSTDHRQLLLADEPYRLDRGSEREWPVAWQMPWPGDDQVVELLLFDGDETTPYRTLRLWLNVTP